MAIGDDHEQANERENFRCMAQFRTIGREYVKIPVENDLYFETSPITVHETYCWTVTEEDY